MPNLQERLAAMTKDERYKAATPDRQAAMRLALQRKVQSEYDQLKAGPRTQAVGEALGGFSAGVMNSAFLGYGPKIAGAMSPFLSPLAGGGQTEEQIRAGQQQAMAQSPIAAGVGGIAGSFIGPAGTIAKTGGTALANLGGRAAKAAGLGRAVSRLESDFAQRGIQNLASNLAGAAGAISATEATKYRDQPVSIAERVSDAISTTAGTIGSPMGLAMLAGGTLAQTKLTRPPSAELASMVKQYERITGKKVPLETLTDSDEIRSFYDFAARVPGLRDKVQKMRGDAIGGLKTMIDEIGSRGGAARGGREAVRGKAADAVRGVIGSRTKPGSIAAERQGITGGAFKPDAHSTIAATILDASVAKIRASRPRTEASAMDAVFSTFKKRGLRGREILLEDLEAIRKQTAKLAGYTAAPGNARQAMMQERTRKEASDFYDAISEAMRQGFPQYRDAQQVAAKLHAAEQTFAGVKNVPLDDMQAAEFFKGTDVVARFNEMTKRAAPDDIAALRGWYYYRLVRQVMNGQTGVISPERLEKTLAREGRFNSQIVDAVLPGVREELANYAKFSSTMMKGRFGPEGSQTAGRMHQAVGLLLNPWAGGGVAAAAKLIFDVSNPFSSALSILGPIGAKTALRSAMGGMIENSIQSSVRAGPTPFTRSAAAASGVLQNLPQPLGARPRQFTGGQQ